MNKKLCQGIPIESLAWTVAVVGLIFAPIAIIAVALRCYARYVVGRQFGWDDFIILIAAAFLAVLVVLDLYSKLIDCTRCWKTLTLSRWDGQWICTSLLEYRSSQDNALVKGVLNPCLCVATLLILICCRYSMYQKYFTSSSSP